MRYNPKLNLRKTLIHFINGLSSKIQRHVKLFVPTSIEEACQNVDGIEQSVKAPTMTTLTPSTGSAPTYRTSQKSNKSIVSIHPRSVIQRVETNTQFPKKTENTNIQCFNCHCRGHVASKFPYKVLVLGQEPNPNDVVVYFPTPGSDKEIDPLDEHHENEKIEEPPIGLNIVRCILSMPASDDTWKCTNIFHTYAK